MPPRHVEDRETTWHPVYFCTKCFKRLSRVNGNGDICPSCGWFPAPGTPPEGRIRMVKHARRWDTDKAAWDYLPALPEEIIRANKDDDD